MSSRPIDEKIVKLTLDNEDFEKNAAQALKTCGDINFTFNEMNSQDFGGLSGAVDKIAERFTMWGAIVDELRDRIANKLVDAAEKAFDALTFKGMRDGYTEYELKLQNIQTIFNNLKDKGTTLGQISDGLDELNEYADKTVYVFADMTAAIGKFSTQGLDLDTSIESIKGLYNLAGYVGKQSADATSAAQQLSYAIAGNKLSLLQWRSLQGTVGGLPFQKALVETANAMDMLDMEFSEFQERYGSMYNALNMKDGIYSDLGYNPFNTDVMVGALKLFSGELEEADLLTMGFTEDQAQYWYEVGQSAIDASTKIRTFKKGMETIDESIGSGWAKSLEYILGDYNQAGELWTRVFEPIAAMTDAFGDARNQWLKTLAEGSFDIEHRIGKNIGDLGYAPVSDYDQFLKIMKIYGFGDMDEKKLQSMVEEMGGNWNEAVFKGLSDAEEDIYWDYGRFLMVLLEQLGETDGIYSGIKLIQTMEDGKEYFSLMGLTWDEALASSLEENGVPVQKALKEMLWSNGIMTGRDALIEGFANIFSFIGEVFKPVGILFSWLKNEFVSSADGVTDTLVGFYQWTVKLKQFSWAGVIENFKNNFTTLYTLLIAMGDAIRQGNFKLFIQQVEFMAGGVFDKATGTLGAFGNVLLFIKDALIGFGDFVAKNPLVWIMGGIAAILLLKKKLGTTNDKPDTLVGGIVGVLNGVSTFLNSFGDLAKSINGLTKALKILGFGIILASVKMVADGLKTIASIPWTSLLKSLIFISGTIAAMVFAVKYVTKLVEEISTTKLLATALLVTSFGASLILISSAFYAISKYDTASIAIAAGVVYLMVKLLSSITKTLTKLDTTKIALNILAFAGLVATISVSLAILSLMNPVKVLLGVAALGGVLYAISKLHEYVMASAVVMKKQDMNVVNVFNSYAKVLLALVPVFLSITASITVLTGVMYIIGKMNFGTMIQGIVGILALATILVGVSYALIQLSGAIEMVESSSVIVSKATGGITAKFGGIHGMLYGNDKKFSLFGLLLGGKSGRIGLEESEFNKEASTMNKQVTKSHSKLIELGATLVLLSLAIGKLAKAVKLLGSMDLLSMGQGLLGIASLFGIIYAFVYYTPKIENAAIVSKFGGVATAIALLGIVAAAIGKSKWQNLAKGVAVIGAIFLELGLFMWGISSFADGFKGETAKALGKMLLQLTVGMIALAAAMGVVSLLSWESIGKGMLVFAVALGGVIAVAWLAKSVEPGLIGLGTALLGLGTALKGLGTVMIGSAALLGVILLFDRMGGSLEAFANIVKTGTRAMLSAVGEFFVEILNSLASYIPELCYKLVGGIILIAATIADNAMYIAEAIRTVIIQITIAIADNIYKYGGDTLGILIDALATVLMGLVKALAENVARFIDGLFHTKISKAIGDGIDSLMDKFRKFTGLDGVRERLEKDASGLKKSISKIFGKDPKVDKAVDNMFGLSAIGGKLNNLTDRSNFTTNFSHVASMFGYDAKDSDLSAYATGKGDINDLLRNVIGSNTNDSAVTSAKGLLNSMGYDMSMEEVKGFISGQNNLRDTLLKSATDLKDTAEKGLDGVREKVKDFQEDTKKNPVTLFTMKTDEVNSKQLVNKIQKAVDSLGGTFTNTLGDSIVGHKIDLTQTIQELVADSTGDAASVEKAKKAVEAAGLSWDNNYAYGIKKGNISVVDALVSIILGATNSEKVKMVQSAVQSAGGTFINSYANGIARGTVTIDDAIDKMIQTTADNQSVTVARKVVEDLGYQWSEDYATGILAGTMTIGDAVKAAVEANKAYTAPEPEKPKEAVKEKTWSDQHQLDIEEQMNTESTAAAVTGHNDGKVYADAYMDSKEKELESQMNGVTYSNQNTSAITKTAKEDGNTYVSTLEKYQSLGLSLLGDEYNANGLLFKGVVEEQTVTAFNKGKTTKKEEKIISKHAESTTKYAYDALQAELSTWGYSTDNAMYANAVQMSEDILSSQWTSMDISNPLAGFTEEIAGIANGDLTGEKAYQKGYSGYISAKEKFDQLREKWNTNVVQPFKDMFKSDDSEPGENKKTIFDNLSSTADTTFFDFKSVIATGKQLVDEFSGWWNETAKPNLDAFGRWWDGLFAEGGAVYKFFHIEDWMIDTAGPWLSEHISNIFEGLTTWWNETAKPNLDAFGRWWDGLFAEGGTIYKLLHWEDMFTKDGGIGALLDGIITGITDFFGGAGKFVFNLPDYLANFSKGNKQAAKDIGGYSAEGISEGFEEKMNASDTKSKIETAGNKLVEDVNGVLEINSPSKVTYASGEYAAEGLIRGFCDKMRNSSEAIRSGAGLTETAARTTLTSSKFSTIGSQCVAGLINGFRTISSNTSTFSTIFSGIVSVARGAFGIHSPSRVFGEIGLMNIQGLANGMINNANIAANATKTISDRVLEAVSIVNQDVLDGINDDMELNPVITPIVNADEVYELEKLLGSKSFQAVNIGRNQNGKGSTESNTVIKGLNVQVVVQATGNTSIQDIAKVAREQAQDVITKEIRKIVWKS